MNRNQMEGNRDHVRPRYNVIVADNFHYMDPSHHWKQGSYETCEQAIAVCRCIVERSIAASYKPGISADALFKNYVSFGDDPFVVSTDYSELPVNFSAREYAAERCRAMCADRLR